MKAPFMRTPYNYDRDEASLETALVCKDPSLAQQQYLEESDINFIAERAGLNGEMPQIQNLPSYENYEGIFDFQTAMNTIRAAQENFMTYPAKLRERFQNDPQRFLEFVEDPENADEAVKLGLAVKRPEPAPDPKPVIITPETPKTPTP